MLDFVKRVLGLFGPMIQLLQWAIAVLALAVRVLQAVVDALSSGSLPPSK